MCVLINGFFLISDSAIWLSFVVQSLSHIWLFVTPWTAASQAPVSFTVSWSLLQFMSIELVMLSNHLILGRPFLLLPSIIPSITFFSNELALCIRWPKLGGQKFWSFSISPCNEYSGLISFRIDWFDLLEVQGILNKSSAAPQFESINFSMLSLPYSPTLTCTHDCWKDHSFDYMDLVCSVLSVFLNMLSRFVIAFLPRSKHLLISWLQSLSTVILSPRKETLSLLPLFLFLVAVKWWDRMLWY